MDLKHLTTEVESIQPSTRRFEVEPSEIYPAAVTDLLLALEEGRAVAGALAMYKAQARQVDTETWELAMLPRDSVTSPVAVAARATALELARLWFTETLHQSIDHVSMELCILKNADWRL